MFSPIHEAAWRIVFYCLLAAISSLLSLGYLLRQSEAERNARLQEAITSTLTEHSEELETDDPVDILMPQESPFRRVWFRSLLIVTHCLVFLGSVYFMVPALKSAFYIHRGNRAYAEHNYDEAVKSYESALAANPSAEFLHMQMQTSLAQRDDKGGELGQMRHMVDLHPGNQGGHNDLGNALMQKGDIPNAILEYEQAIALKPNDPIAHNNMGNALKTAGRLPESIAEFRKALALDPTQTPSYYNLANALLENNQIKEAIKYFHLALDRDPKLAPIYYNLAHALDKQGKKAEAIAAMQQFIQLAKVQPEFGPVLERAQKQIADWKKTN